MRLSVLLMLLLCGISCFGDDMRIVEATYRYVMPDHCTRTEAKATAMERAISDALAREFGSTVNAETWTETHNAGDVSKTDVWRLGSSTVNGEWIETIGEPQFRFVTDGDAVAVEVRMKGRVAPLAPLSVDLQYSTRRVSHDGVFETQRLNSGDRLEVSFSSPVDGHLLMFLDDGDGIVSQILPFASERSAAADVTGGKSYLFFHDAREAAHEQYTLSTDKEIERNVLYILFTPNRIVKPATSESSGIRYLSTKAFRDWLSARRHADKELQIRAVPLTILNLER